MQLISSGSENSLNIARDVIPLWKAGDNPRIELSRHCDVMRGFYVSKILQGTLTCTMIVNGATIIVAHLDKNKLVLPVVYLVAAQYSQIELEFDYTPPNTYECRRLCRAATKPHIIGNIIDIIDTYIGDNDEPEDFSVFAATELYNNLPRRALANKSHIQHIPERKILQATNGTCTINNYRRVMQIAIEPRPEYIQLVCNNVLIRETDDDAMHRIAFNIAPDEPGFIVPFDNGTDPKMPSIINTQKLPLELTCLPRAEYTVTVLNQAEIICMSGIVGRR
jgi:hypothetical protein